MPDEKPLSRAERRKVEKIGFLRRLGIYEPPTCTSPDIQEPDWPMLSGGFFGKKLMSNFDREVNQDVAQRLRDEHVLAKYPGWNFNADCWFADGQFHAAVYVHHIRRAIVSAETPEALMVAVSDVFGWD